jgi:hypothetical protein
MPFLLFDSSRCQGKGKPCPHCLALVGTRGYPPHASRKGGEVFHNLKAIRDGGNLFLYWTIRSPPPHASQGMRLLSPPPALGRSKGAGGVPLLLAKHGGRMRIPKGCAHPWCEAWMRFGGGAGLIKFRIKGILKQDKVYTIAIAHPSPKG